MWQRLGCHFACLFRKAKELLIATRFVFTNCGEVLVFVTDEHDRAPLFIRSETIRGIRFRLLAENPFSALRQSPLPVRGSCQQENSKRLLFLVPKVLPLGEVADDRKKWTLPCTTRLEDRCPLDGGTVIKKGQKNGNAFDNGCLKFLVDPLPIVFVPALDSLQLFFLVGVRCDAARFVLQIRLNRLLVSDQLLTSQSPRSDTSILCRQGLNPTLWSSSAYSSKIALDTATKCLPVIASSASCILRSRISGEIAHS